MLRLLKHTLTPILLLLTINLAAGLLTFRDFGLAWDEPLFYNYADNIWKAYTPAAFSPGFDFEQVYGRSAADHKFYGPAYLLLALPIERAFTSELNLDMASAWHLVNFLTFQVGLLGLYRLLRRWVEPWPAAAAAAFCAWQPVFWGHAFINPKDMPFMVFFLWALTLGLEAVDGLTAPQKTTPNCWVCLLMAGFLLGLTSAIRVIGPLAGVILFFYFLSRLDWKNPRPSAWLGFALLGLAALLTMFIFWPYLWADPINRLVEVLRHMSDNPTELAVLFDGQIFRANDMPRRYLSQLLALALTEPTWPLFTAGLFLAARQAWQKKLDPRAPLAVLSLFALMMAYLVYFVPSMYDGFRHFLFILPPVFVFAGFAFQGLWDLRRGLFHSGENAAETGAWRRVGKEMPIALAALMLIPGLLGSLQLHPYEYAYYNRFAGGVGGAFRVYETEYWLTCYKQAIGWVQANDPGATLHIQREMDLAQYYGAGLTLKDLGQEADTDIQPGDLLLFHTRANLDIRSVYRKLPVVTSFGRDGAQFCIIKKKE